MSIKRSFRHKEERVVDTLWDEIDHATANLAGDFNRQQEEVLFQLTKTTMATILKYRHWMLLFQEYLGVSHSRR